MPQITLQPNQTIVFDGDSLTALRKPYYEVQEKMADELENVQALDVGTGLKAKAQAHYARYADHNVYSDGTHFSNLGGMILAGEVLKACGVIGEG